MIVLFCFERERERVPLTKERVCSKEKHARMTKRGRETWKEREKMVGMEEKSAETTERDGWRDVRIGGGQGGG